MEDGLVGLYAELLQDGGVVLGIILEKSFRNFVIGRFGEPCTLEHIQICTINNNTCLWSSGLKFPGEQMVKQRLKHHLDNHSILELAYDG